MSIDIEEWRVILGERIKQAREEADLTQETLAKELGNTKASISKIEQGINFTTVPNLIIIKKMTHKPYNFLLNEINSENNMTLKEQELLEIYRELSGASQLFVENCLKLVVKNCNQKKKRKITKKIEK